MSGVSVFRRHGGTLKDRSGQNAVRTLKRRVAYMIVPPMIPKTVSAKDCVAEKYVRSR
jgi:hypothetical protein